MPLEDHEYDELVSPWKDGQPPAPRLDESEVIKRLNEQVEAAVANPATRPAP